MHTIILAKLCFDKTRNILTNWYFILHVGGLLQNGTWSTLTGNLLTFYFRCQRRSPPTCRMKYQFVSIFQVLSNIISTIWLSTNLMNLFTGIQLYKGKVCKSGSRVNWVFFTKMYQFSNYFPLSFFAWL